MRYRSLLLSAAALGAALPAPAALAQAADVAPLVVQALPLGRSQSEVAAPVVTLTGDELVFQRRATLGETLSSQPGINSDTFGGGASRPVIRGQTAPRVKVLSDSSEVLDASQVSPDHAVVTEPLLLTEIEVLRGPSALIYGGGAIGGAVNLIDEKVPTRLPEGLATGVAEARVGTNAEEGAGVAGVTLGLGSFAFRAEGVRRGMGDYKDGAGRRVAGTAAESTTGTLGLSFIGSNGFLGAAFTSQRSDYGLPGHEHGHEFEECHPHGSSLHCGGHDHDEDDHDHEEEDHGEETPVVDLMSDRFDLRGEMRNPMAGIDRIRLRGGYTTYRHHEIEHEVIATTFKNQGWDGRLEVEHSPLSGWRGVLGVQAVRNDFSALGAEAFLPATDTSNTGVFILEEFSSGPFTLELAGRKEWQRIAPAIPSATRPRTEHSPFSASAGAIWSLSPGYSLSLSLTRSQRAPTSQELYARGVHLATNTYELGTPTLRTETSNAADLTFRKTDGDTTWTASVFVNRFDGYIFANTLDQEEEFRLIRYEQADARFVGFDAQLAHQITDAFSISVFGDYVRAKLTGGENLPRIPAARLGAHLDYKAGPVTADIEYFHVFSQGRVAGFETKTPGYDMVNLTLAYDLPFESDRGEAQLYLRGANLLDQLAFNHASFIKSAAPLAGRTFTLGVRTRF
jgi:iron complex outermembrane receptor protein